MQVDATTQGAADAPLAADVLRRLQQRSDRRGLLRLAGHLVLIAATGWLYGAARARRRRANRSRRSARGAPPGAGAPGDRTAAAGGEARPLPAARPLLPAWSHQPACRTHSEIGRASCRER